MSDARVVHVFYARASAWTAEATLQGEALLERHERDRAARFHFDGAVLGLSSAHVSASLGAVTLDDARDWRFVSWSIEGAYRVALAVKTSEDVRIALSSL